MKVKELIEILNKLNGDLPIKIQYAPGEHYSYLKEIYYPEGNMYWFHWEKSVIFTHDGCDPPEMGR